MFSNVLISLLAFVVVIGFLIFVHEFGHFIVAKLLGIKVEVFSLGFGPRLAGKKWGETDYRLSLLFFLGGYVKMQGEEPDEELEGTDREFLSRSKWERFLVLIMGPLTNIIVAVVLMSFVYVMGINMPAYRGGPPKIGYVHEESPASRAGLNPGDFVMEVNGEKIENWGEFQSKVIINPGKSLNLKIKRDGKVIEREITPKSAGTYKIGNLGAQPPMRFKIDSVMRDLPAFSGGLKKGDIIKSINGENILHPARGVELFSEHPDKEITVTLLRRGEEIQKTIHSISKIEMTLSYRNRDYPFIIAPESEKDKKSFIPKVQGKIYGSKKDIETGDRVVGINGKQIKSLDHLLTVIRDLSDKGIRMTVQKDDEKITATVVPKRTEIKGYIGIKRAPPEMKTKQYSLLPAVKESVKQNIKWIKLLGETLKNLVTGTLSMRAMSGPIDIAKFSGKAAQKGVEFLINFIAFVSLNLGIANLLPIPALDGGHIAILSVEALIRRDLSLKVKERLMQIGIFLLLTLMAVIITLDIIKNIAFLN